MTENDIYLKFNKNDNVVDNFKKNRKNNEKDSSKKEIEYVNIGNTQKNILNRISTGNKEYVITFYYNEKDEKVIEAYVEKDGKFIVPEPNDNVYNIVSNLMKQKVESIKKTKRKI